jgi:hypothetical protein
MVRGKRLGTLFTDGQPQRTPRTQRTLSGFFEARHALDALLQEGLVEVDKVAKRSCEARGICDDRQTRRSKKVLCVLCSLGGCSSVTGRRTVVRRKRLGALITDRLVDRKLAVFAMISKLKDRKQFSVPSASSVVVRP